MMRAVDATIDLLRRSLSRSGRDASVVASNLANVDTPGFRSARVEFAAELGRARSDLDIERTHPSHLGPEADPDRATIVEATVTRLRADGNTVDIDLEMTRLAALQGQYASAAQMVRKRFALLRYTVTDGRS